MRHEMKHAHVRMSAAVSLTLLGGCGGPSDTAPAGTGTGNEGWQPPADYEFVLESSCGERALIGTFGVVIEDGEVAEAEALDESAESLLTSLGVERVPSLGELLDQASTAREEGADVVDVTTDPSDGHPTRIDIDWDTNAVDDEECYVVSDYVVGSDTAADDEDNSLPGEPTAATA